jgi:hypothetical protein
MASKTQPDAIKRAASKPAAGQAMAKRRQAADPAHVRAAVTRTAGDVQSCVEAIAEAVTLSKDKPCVCITDGPTLAGYVSTIRFASQDADLQDLLPPFVMEVCVTLQSMADRSTSAPAWPSAKALKKLSTAVEKVYSDVGQVPRRREMPYQCVLAWQRVTGAGSEYSDKSAKYDRKLVDAIQRLQKRFPVPVAGSPGKKSQPYRDRGPPRGGGTGHAWQLAWGWWSR